MSSTPDERTPHTISRRSIAKGVAWSAPAIAMATAAPSFAASRNGCIAAVKMTANATSGTQTITASAPGGGCTMTMTITNAVTGCTTPLNMTIGSRGNAVAGQNSCGYTTYNAGMTGLIVQNAPCACQTSSTPEIFGGYARVPDATPASSQDIKFAFSKPVSNLVITVADISSARPNGNWVPGYVGNYYDHVGWSMKPTSISHSSAADKGTGAGTFADPFHRVGADRQSTVSYSEAFSFGEKTVVNSITMRYTNGPTSNNIKGTQAVVIPTVSFDMPCKC